MYDSRSLRGQATSAAIGPQWLGLDQLLPASLIFAPASKSRPPRESQIWSTNQLQWTPISSFGCQQPPIREYLKPSHYSTLNPSCSPVFLWVSAKHKRCRLFPLWYWVLNKQCLFLLIWVVSGYFHMHVYGYPRLQNPSSPNLMAENAHVFAHSFGVRNLGRAQLDGFSVVHMASAGHLGLEDTLSNMISSWSWVGHIGDIGVLWPLFHSIVSQASGTQHMMFSVWPFFLHGSWLPRGKSVSYTQNGPLS